MVEQLASDVNTLISNLLPWLSGVVSSSSSNVLIDSASSVGSVLNYDPVNSADEFSDSDGSSMDREYVLTEDFPNLFAFISKNHNLFTSTVSTCFKFSVSQYSIEFDLNGGYYRLSPFHLYYRTSNFRPWHLVCKFSKAEREMVKPFIKPYVKISYFRLTCLE